MKIEIEVYKGQSIVYNDDNDKFECEIELNNEVRATKRISLKDVRKEIDQFIKVNLKFKPFKFLKKSEYSGKTFGPYFCSAIRTDGKFVVNSEGSNRNSYYGEKEMKLAMVYDAEIVKELEQIESEYEAARLKNKTAIAALYDKLIPCDLSEYKNVINADAEVAGE